MATLTHIRRSSEEVAKLGDEILKTQIEPLLGSQNKGKFVAIAVDNGDYEMDVDDHAALSRLLARRPEAEIWLSRIGYPAAYKMKYHL